MSPRDLGTGVGKGLPADTFIGPVRLDLRAGEEDRHRVYASAGIDPSGRATGKIEKAASDEAAFVRMVSSRA
jgi:hypothetical protein